MEEQHTGFPRIVNGKDSSLQWINTAEATGHNWSISSIALIGRVQSMITTHTALRERRQIRLHPRQGYH